eukprot:TRINITY_DN15596_c0_g1::TRINITY_DN15596_c0_g1_i1::g.28565::m.28565 TRINITY_DN15596_c0_g1::TRINITY_DN15596_c0_g1_i1::g.28565  ORF type:complete len:147 (+),score=13.05 TRINITY_DN15596_c0_g1_i1:110-550(+)
MGPVCGEEERCGWDWCHYVVVQCMSVYVPELVLEDVVVPVHWHARKNHAMEVPSRRGRSAPHHHHSSSRYPADVYGPDLDLDLTEVAYVPVSVSDVSFRTDLRYVTDVIVVTDRADMAGFVAVAFATDVTDVLVIAVDAWRGPLVA